MRPEGKGPQRLTYSESFNGPPASSPDGKTLMWTSNRSENKSQIFMADVSMPDEPAPVAAIRGPEPDFDGKAFRVRTQGIVDAVNANNVEHHVGKLYMDAGLKPIGQFDTIEETSYIQGPSVAGWLPPTG